MLNKVIHHFSHFSNVLLRDSLYFKVIRQFSHWFFSFFMPNLIQWVRLLFQWVRLLFHFRTDYSTNDKPSVDQPATGLTQVLLIQKCYGISTITNFFFGCWSIPQDHVYSKLFLSYSFFINFLHNAQLIGYMFKIILPYSILFIEPASSTFFFFAALYVLNFKEKDHIN